MRIADIHAQELLSVVLVKRTALNKADNLSKLQKAKTSIHTVKGKQTSCLLKMFLLQDTLRQPPKNSSSWTPSSRGS